MARAIPIGWPGLIGKCRSIFLGYSYLSMFLLRLALLRAFPALADGFTVFQHFPLVTHILCLMRSDWSIQLFLFAVTGKWR